MSEESNLFILSLDNEVLEQCYQEHENYHGEDYYERIVDQAIEEMSELIKVLLKERRGRDIAEKLRDELADVMMCLEYIARNHDISAEVLDSYLTKKCKKWLKNMEDGKA